MTFLRELHEQDNNNRESAEHQRIREQIHWWIYDAGSPITDIFFDTTESGAGNLKVADIRVVNTQGRILLSTPIHSNTDLGEEGDGDE